MQELSDALVRIEGLERANRRMRRAGAALATLLLLAALVPISTAFTHAAPEAGRAEALRGSSLELIDASGEVYASMSVDPNGFPLLLMRKDKAHAALSMSGPALHLRAADGRRGVFAGFDTQGVGKLEVADANLTARAGLEVGAEGAPALRLRDDGGFVRAGLEYVEAGASLLTLNGEGGRLRAAHGVDERGNASTVLLDSSGRRRIGMLVEPDGTPLLSMEDEKTRPRLNLTMDFDGAPRLQFMREDGGVGSELP